MFWDQRMPTAEEAKRATEAQSKLLLKKNMRRVRIAIRRAIYQGERHAIAEVDAITGPELRARLSELGYDTKTLPPHGNRLGIAWGEGEWLED